MDDVYMPDYRLHWNQNYQTSINMYLKLKCNYIKLMKIPGDVEPGIHNATVK